MSAELNPAAPHNLPFFIPGPDGSDPLLFVTGLFLIVAVIAFGLIFLRIHTLPERMAHRTHKVQFQVVAVLGLLALFTHNQIFWVIGLFLALLLPPKDRAGQVVRMARMNCLGDWYRRARWGWTSL